MERESADYELNAGLRCAGVLCFAALCYVALCYAALCLAWLGFKSALQCYVVCNACIQQRIFSLLVHPKCLSCSLQEVL
jgi:hypothetical protein